MPNLGIIVPDMGMNDISRSGKVSEAAARYATASLSSALFTTTQQRVLACLFGESGRSYAVNELIQATGAGSGAVVVEASFRGVRRLDPQQHYYLASWSGARSRGTLPGGCRGIANQLEAATT